MERLKRFWYKLVAKSLYYESKELGRTVIELKAKIVRLQIELEDALKPRPLAADINAMLRRSLENRLAQDAVVGDDVRILRGKIDLLHQQLVNELAYSTYLEENLVPNTTPFNDLPREQRQAYFECIKAKI